MLTQDKAKIQVTSFQFQAVAQYQADPINPSRSITPDDETYLRNYALAAAVLSWNECTCGTPEQLTAADSTNIAIADDTVWYQIQLHRAIPIDIETFHAHRLQIQQHSSNSDALTAEPQPQQPQPALLETQSAQQLVGWAGDSTGCQLRLDWQAVVEYESGLAHGKLDAASRMPPICTEASCHYSQGYLDAYQSFLATSQQPPQNLQPVRWSVVYDSKWNLYQVWIGDRCLQQKAIDYEEAERIAQKYFAAEELRSAHRELVLVAFAP